LPPPKLVAPFLYQEHAIISLGDFLAPAAGDRQDRFWQFAHMPSWFQPMNESIILPRFNQIPDRSSWSKLGFFSGSMYGLSLVSAIADS
jgi:hypothetical protein